MDSKMKKLIQKLNLSDECNKALENSELEKIVASKDKTNYCFYIDIDNILNVELYNEFSEKLKKSFDMVDKVNVIFNPKNINDDLLIEHFKSVLNFYSKESLVLSIFLNNK